MPELPELLQGLPLPDGIDEDALAVACARIREHCDWHIAPVVTETITLDVPRSGIVLLPTLRLVDVASVNGATSGFTFTRWGRITLTSIGYYGTATVTFTHGYDACPPSVAAAAAQIATRGLVPAAQMKSDTTGPYTASWYELADPLDDVQPYRRVGVA